MAYLDLNHHFASGALAVGSIAVTPDHQDELSALEWNVVALARRDSLASLREPGPLSRAFGGLFGMGAASKLADPRLEALRRFAVHAWHRGYALPESSFNSLLEAGFSVSHAESVLASITGVRAGQSRRRAA